METTYTKYHRSFYEKHKDELKSKMSAYQKEYYKRNRDRILSRVKAYQDAKRAATEATVSPAAEAAAPEN